MKRYFLHWPGMVYALTVYGFSKRDAITRFKKQDQVFRMPNNYSIWEG